MTAKVLRCEFTADASKEVIGAFCLLREHQIPVTDINWMDDFLGSRHILTIHVNLDPNHVARAQLVDDLQARFEVLSRQ